MSHSFRFKLPRLTEPGKLIFEIRSLNYAWPFVMYLLIKYSIYVIAVGYALKESGV